MYGHDNQPTATPKFTIEDAAKQALMVQDACNLSGVVHSFARVMDLLAAESLRLGKGTDWKNHHPIAILFSSKIASLTGSESSIFTLTRSMKWCEKAQNGEIEETPFGD